MEIGIIINEKKHQKHTYIVVREGVKVEKKSTIIIVLFLRGRGGSEVIIVLFILILKWPNSSRNAKKKFSPW